MRKKSQRDTRKKLAPKKKHKTAETHQQASAGIPVLTTAQGIPISDDQNSLRVAPQGPTLLEDFPLRDKIFHFDHERIPERVVHARGYAAHGFFEMLTYFNVKKKKLLFLYASLPWLEVKALPI